MLYRIGEFSKKTNVSIKTLRYYDEINLFHPVEVDLFTNYRYYREEQIEDLKLIQNLKEVGFTLEEIKQNWNHFGDDFFLNQKRKLLEEVEFKKAAIRKIDQLRSKLEDGKIVKEWKQKSIKKKKLF